MILRRALPALVLVVLSAGVASAASPKEKAEARALVNDAKKAMKDKRFADAEQALRRANDLDASPQTSVDLASALAAEGKLVEASRMLHDVDASAAAAPATKKTHEQLKKALAEIEPRIPWIQVDVGGPSAGQSQTSIDGKDIDASSEVPLDPGDHKVAVAAEGFEPAEKSVSLSEGAHEHLRLDLTPIAKAPPPPVAKRSSAPAIVAFSLGGAGLIVGGAAGVAALSQTRDARSQCAGNLCPPSAASAIDRSKRSGTISTVGFIAGGVGVAAGIILLLVAPGSAKEAPAKEQAHVTPWIGAGQAGLSGSF
jgi:hypothetical protein